MVSKALSLCACYPLPEGINNENENEDEDVPSSARLSTYGAQENEDEDEKMSDNKKARNFRNYMVWMDSVDYATRIYWRFDHL